MKTVRNIFLLLTAFAVLYSTQLPTDFKSPKHRILQREPETVLTGGSDFTPVRHFQNPLRNMSQFSLIDSSKNGYGMIEAGTRPLSVSEEGWLFAYRQWAGANGTSGQMGSAYSPDGINWTVYTNLNPSLGSARFPSAIATEDYPFIFWNERAPENGRPYFCYDEFGWDGGSFSEPYDVDVLWNNLKDLWVGSPVYAFDAENGLSIFNIAFADWTRQNVYLFHSEEYDDGYIIFGNEVKIIDVETDLESDTGDGTTYTSSPVLDINADGIGYAAVSGFFLGANSIPPSSPYANSHTIIFKKTANYGATWSGGQAGSPYYFIPDNLFSHIMDSGEFPGVYHSECDGDDTSEDIVFEQLFCTYDLDIKVDSDGNPHFLVGVLGSVGEFVYPGIPYNGMFHLWIDKDYILNPGPAQTATGWNYSRVMDTSQMWRWDNEDDTSFWQMVFPSFTISSEDEAVMWVAVSGPSPGEFVVTDDAGTPDDECDDLGVYPTWNEEVFVIKSEDGGVTWWTPYNMTQTETDCWVDENLDVVCNDDIICEDGSTMDEPDEIGVHVAKNATNDILPLVYQRPDWCAGSTTGDGASIEHKNRLYAGWVELTENPDQTCHLYGDVNLDEDVDILDIVALVNHILYGTILPAMDCADYNQDGTIDILDIVGILNCILYEDCNGAIARMEEGFYASWANLIRNENTVELESNGQIGAIQMVLEHNDDFSIDLTQNALVSGVNVRNGMTRLILVNPGEKTLFTTEGDFSIKEVKIAAGRSYIETNIASQYPVLNSFPNPFNPVTTIQYELPTASNIRIAVYDMLGQEVTELIHSDMNAGKHNVVWNANEFSSGLYFVKMSFDDQVTIKKVLLIK